MCDTQRLLGVGAAAVLVERESVEDVALLRELVQMESDGNVIAVSQHADASASELERQTVDRFT